MCCLTCRSLSFAFGVAGRVMRDMCCCRSDAVHNDQYELATDDEAAAARNGGDAAQRQALVVARAALIIALLAFIVTSIGTLVSAASFVLQNFIYAEGAETQDDIAAIKEHLGV